MYVLNRYKKSENFIKIKIKHEHRCVKKLKSDNLKVLSF